MNQSKTNYKKLRYLQNINVVAMTNVVARHGAQGHSSYATE